jgi:hypothetical protein
MTTINTSEILSRASSKNITANELDILVSKSQELNSVRDRKIKRLQCMLEKVESQLDK